MESIVLISIDALRNDRLDSDGFPKCWPLFNQDFVRFTNAYSHGVATPFAFPGIMTGTPPSNDGSLPKDTPTIAELLSTFDSAGFSNNPHLIESRGYDRGFDRFDFREPPDDQTSVIEYLKTIGRFIEHPWIQKAYSEFRSNVSYGGDITPPLYTPAEEVATFISRELSGNNRSFVWGHFMDPHFPFNPYTVTDDEFETGLTDDELRRHVEEGGKGFDIDLETAERLYDANIRYLDQELYNLFSRLQSDGSYEDSLIIVTADHGELFGEHDLEQHPWDADPVDELIHVPLLIKYHGNQDGGQSLSHTVSHSDIIATINGIEGDGGADLPDGVYPLRDQTSRDIISKSNRGIRVTTADGSAIRRRDGTTTTVGQVSEKAIQVLDNTPFPRIEELSGELTGVNDEEHHDVQQRLENLGYK
jgi:arylsulfatase A-like enzyme